MEVIENLVNQLQQYIAVIIPGAAIIGIGLWAIAFLVKGWDGSWARSLEGFLQTAIWVVIVAGASPVLIPALFGLFAQGG